MLAPDIQENVRRELRFDPRVDESRIDVAATDSGVVTLTGTAETYSQKIAAGAAAERVIGVRAVANDIEVALPIATGRTDTQIAEAAVTSLQWRPTIPADRIKVAVSDGWVTLDGEVDFYHQKQEAELVASALHGVKGVTNNLYLRPAEMRPNPTQVKQEIEDALVRSARLDAGGINVRVEDSCIILEGTVRTAVEIAEAEDAAWSATGVSEVKNRLRVVA
jgi:osmotically-inducible protein OsmY